MFVNYNFPKITICNNNQFTTEYSVEFIRNVNEKYYPKANIFNESQMSNLTSSEKYDLILKIYSSATSESLSKTFTDYEKKQLGHSLEDILLSCNFNNQKCSHQDFVWDFDRYYGKFKKNIMKN